MHLMHHLPEFTFNTLDLANYVAKLPNDYITLGGIKFHKIELSDVIASYEEDRISLFDLYDLIECLINIKKMVTVQSRFDRLKKSINN